MEIIGHRGAAALKPENSASSFMKAIELSVSMIEFDVHRCASGEIVVIHDDDVFRTTGVHAKVKDISLQQLKQLDIGEGQRILTLEELLDLVDIRVKVNIEIKALGICEQVRNIIEEYVDSKNWHYEDFLVSSFNYEELSYFSNHNPAIKIAAAIDEAPRAEFWKFVTKNSFYAVNPCFTIVNKNLVELANKHGLKLMVWTVNEPIVFNKLIDYGVDAVFTDNPSLFIV